ncbi:MAG: hypothetical protein LBU48_06760 [Coriobacteriales bacterium]|nr:hypothetical protein [Coriobacteriales bacterium]
MLSDRRQKVLHALVDEYVASAVPVGSATLTQRYTLGISPATVRNELMALEENGYVVSPHVSAGRIPTGAGYRIYVNTLLLCPEVQRSLWGGIPASHPAQDGHSRTEPVLSLDALSQQLSDSTDCLAVVWAPRVSATLYRKGMPRVLAQPEFHDASLAIPLMQLLESSTALVRLLESTFDSSGLRIMIGGESRDTQETNFSMVAACYGRMRRDGVVALFGPTRMDYRKAIRAVCSTSHVLETMYN